MNLKPCKFKITPGDHNGKHYTQSEVVNIVLNTARNPMNSIRFINVSSMDRHMILDSRGSLRSSRGTSEYSVSKHPETTWQAFLDSLAPVLPEVAFLTGLKELMEKTGVWMYSTGHGHESYIGIEDQETMDQLYDDLFEPNTEGVAMVNPATIDAKIKELQDEA